MEGKGEWNKDRQKKGDEEKGEREGKGRGIDRKEGHGSMIMVKKRIGEKKRWKG